MSDAHQFSKDIIRQLEASDLDTATIATIHCMAVVSAAHGDLHGEDAMRFLRERLLPLVEKLLAMMERDRLGGRLQ